jgi:hypothetical protein
MNTVNGEREKAKHWAKDKVFRYTCDSCLRTFRTSAPTANEPVLCHACFLAWTYFLPYLPRPT